MFSRILWALSPPDWNTICSGRDRNRSSWKGGIYAHSAYQPIIDDNLAIYNRSGLNEDLILNLMSGRSVIEYLGIIREEQMVFCRYYLALLSSLHECGI